MQDYPWWNDSHRKLRVEAAEYTERVLVPLAEKAVLKREYPWEAARELAKTGWYGATIPKKYGGRFEELGVTGGCILAEEVGRAGALSFVFSTSIVGGMQQIVHDGTEEQKQRWLPAMARGDLIGCITMTEPYAGSDVAAIETTAVRDGDCYIVNGVKRFQTSAAAADLYMSYFKTSDDPAARKSYRHLSGMIVEKGTPGFSVERVNDWLGAEGMYNCYLRFDNARVPIENVIGGEGNGWQVMMRGLNIERSLGAAGPLGALREAIRYARQHLERRVQFGQTTGAIPSNQMKLADMYSKYQMARLLIYYSAYCSDLGLEVPIEAALCKLYISEAGFEIAQEAIQCMGGNGVMKIYPVERIMREMKLYQIAAGTSEVLRLLIYRMGNGIFAQALEAPLRMIEEETGMPLPVGVPPERKPVTGEMDILKVLAENYRVNPGLHMTVKDIKQFLDVSDADLATGLKSLEEKGQASTLFNRKGGVEMAKATLVGIGAANPPEYYRHIPDWVRPEDVF
ncbi:MAG: acyl-CoA dehydrogenase family protein [Pseudomonadota bacterium]